MGFKDADLTYWELVTFGLFFVELYINFTQMNSHEIRENNEKMQQAETRLFSLIKAQPTIDLEDRTNLINQNTPFDNFMTNQIAENDEIQEDVVNTIVASSCLLEMHKSQILG